jgi:glucose-6-phosphate 1-dehydrogenase
MTLEAIWIFGATGDLSRRKLLPALEMLYREGRDFVVIGVGRREMTHEAFRAFAAQRTEVGVRISEVLLQRLYYVALEFDQMEKFEALKATQLELESVYGMSRRTLFFMATKPEYFAALAEVIYKSGIAQGTEAALILEKPFGYDLETARRFNEGIRKYFSEKEIFRTDHYLGKAMMRNVLTLRFANTIFDAVWCKESIKEVRVVAWESIGIEERGDYYNQAGALRDMVQNHLLQMVALTAMEPPLKLTPEDIRSAKLEVLSRLSLDEKHLVVGQYTPSEFMKGYLEEEGIGSASNTETFAALTLQVETKRWRGVPFHLVTGKRLAQKRTAIEIVMKSAPLSEQFVERIVPNLIEIKVQPEEGVRIEFNARQPASDGLVVARELDFCQSCLVDERSPEAYEKLLLDALNGDPTLFTSWGEIEQAWSLIDPLVNRVREGSIPLRFYKAGTQGPDLTNL